MKLRVYGKINMSLCVMNRVGNMHRIDSIMASVSVFDSVEVLPRSDGEITVRCGELSGQGNTAYRAARAYAEKYGTNGADVTVKKGIPFGGGLGGSSADAAAVFVAMREIYGVEPSAELMRSVGSDVPFMYSGGIARVGGLGEKVESLPFCEFSAVLLTPNYSADTAAAYAALDEQRGVKAGLWRVDEAVAFECDGAAEMLLRSNAFEAFRRGVNDLETVSALSAEAAEFDERLAAAVCRGNERGEDLCAKLCGSGSSHVILSRNGDFSEETLADFAKIAKTTIVKSVPFGVKMR